MISDETRKKMSESAKKRVARGILPNNIGKAAWNKGLKASDHPSIQSYAEKQKGQKRTGNYDSPTRWQGEGNPWYGKSRSGSIHPRYNPDRHKREYQDWISKVIYHTEKTYAQYKDEINPHDYPRTLCGVEGGYQLDHIISIDEGWKRGLSIEMLTSKENLQMLPWLRNRLKSNSNSSPRFLNDES